MRLARLNIRPIRILMNYKSALAGLLSLLAVATSYAAPVSSATLNTEVQKLHQIAPALDNKVLKLALTAYHKGQQKGMDKQGLLTVIDFSKPSTQRRMWILDINQDKLLYKLHVAHGQKSGGNIPNKFSNKVNSHASSLGLYKTANGYIGKNGYSLRLAGLEPGFNSNAMKRAVVIHGSKYTTPHYAKTHARLGRSWGCPAIDKAVSTQVINKIKNGTLVFAYYPDKNWLSHSQYLA